MNTLPHPKIMGYSHEHRPIELYTFGDGPVKVLILGGVHGDEVEGFTVTEKFLNLHANLLSVSSPRLCVLICPRLNPDGCAEIKRANAKGVDLNRNLPTQNWTGTIENSRYYPGTAAGSEPETQALIQILTEVKPNLILSLHSYAKPMVNYDGVISKEVAEVMAKANGLEPKGDIGYPTTGSLGNYAAMERNIPTVTLEILKGKDLNEAWAEQEPALFAALAWANTKL